MNHSILIHSSDEHHIRYHAVTEAGDYMSGGTLSFRPLHFAGKELLCGAIGGIGGTYGAMPELIVKLFELFYAGKREEARALQYDVDNIIYALCAGKCNMYASIKEVLRRREGLDLGGVRPPLAAYTAADDAAIAHAVSLIDLAVKRWIG